MFTSHSSVVIVLKHIRDEMLMEHPHFLRDWHSLLLQHLKIHFHSHSFITSKAGQHFIEHHSDSPNIALFRILVLSVCFRRHVLGRTYIIKTLRFVRHFLHFAIPKINDSYLLTLIRVSFEENIIWF